MAPWFPRDFKPWSDRICDTMVVWSGRDFIGLERLAHALGIEMAETIAGKDIPAAYHEGRLDEIIAHNVEDLRVTREIYRRIVAVE